jgi:mRNA interferase MazF
MPRVIEPWQVWLADLDPTVEHGQGAVRPVLVISSAFHLRINVGRTVTVTPMTNRLRNLSYRVPVQNPHRQETTYVVTDQVRTISTLRFRYTEPWWTLNDGEISEVRRSLINMVDL